ncbi:MAG: peptidylprolyl isomerase [Devosiaceae bacterium]|nr:peptidylprolyl isomerase [Devosiaceae bacterium MH13]
MTGAVAVFSSASAFVAAPTAHAQTVYTAILVNDIPITNFDIDSRVALLRLQGASSAQARSRAEDELIDETLQRAEGRWLGISVTQAELDDAMSSIAGRSNLTTSQLNQALRQRGVDPQSLRDSIETQMLWNQIIRARFQATVQVDEQEVLAALGSRTETEDGAGSTDTEYTLREVIFIVPSDAGAGATARREREASAFRARFESCAAGINSARQLNGVVVQEEFRRFASDLNAELQELLDETAVGRLTPPETSEEGVTLIAVCNKREIRSDAAARRDVESDLRNEEGVLLSRGYLRDLRASATIIRPEQ